MKGPWSQYIRLASGRQPGVRWRHQPVLASRFGSLCIWLFSNTKAFTKVTHSFQSPAILSLGKAVLLVVLRMLGLFVGYALNPVLACLPSSGHH